MQRIWWSGSSRTSKSRRSEMYNETQLHQESIDPSFKAQAAPICLRPGARLDPFT